MGFIVGCVLTALVAMAALAPTPAPASARTGGAALRVTLTDSLLTTAMDSGQQSSALSLSQARAHIQSNGRIIISGVLQGSPLGAGNDVTVVAQPYVSQNALAIKVLRASVSGFAVPPATLATLTDQVNRQLTHSSHVSLGVGQNLVVSTVTFADGSMTVSYAPVGA